MREKFCQHLPITISSTVRELAAGDRDGLHTRWLYCCCAACGSKLLEARVRMQQKYLQQFHDLYEDFHLVKLPLLEEEVRGVDALRDFSKYLMTPYKPPAAPAAQDREAALQSQVIQLKARVAELEALLEAARK